MKKLILSSLILFTCFTACKKKDQVKEKLINREPAVVETRIKIAVIDTGIADTKETKAVLCKVGHRDFVGDGLVDKHGHGTNIAGIISKGMDTTKFCLVIFKYYHNGEWANNNLRNEISALEEAIKQEVKFINFSGGGMDESKKETEVVNLALSKGIKIIVAAGNDGNDLGKKCIYFPACIPDTTGNLYPVGNCKDGKYVYSSNFGGPVKQCENGVSVEGFGYRMSGTSQSTAIFTNKLIKSYGQQESKNR